MARYFFDIEDDERFSEDDIGIECETQAAARDAAVEALPDIAKTAIPMGDRYTITVTVRDQKGQNVFRATLTVDTDWLDSN